MRNARPRIRRPGYRRIRWHLDKDRIRLARLLQTNERVRESERQHRPNDDHNPPHAIGILQTRRAGHDGLPGARLGLL